MSNKNRAPNYVPILFKFNISQAKFCSSKLKMEPVLDITKSATKRKVSLQRLKFQIISRSQDHPKLTNLGKEDLIQRICVSQVYTHIHMLV